MERIWYKAYDQGVPATLDYPEVPLYQFLDKAARDSPGTAATIFMGRKMTYEKLTRLADRFAAALAYLGIRKGDRVALFLPNCPPYPIAFFGALKVGAILVPTHLLLEEEELCYRLNDSGAETLVTLDLESLLSRAASLRGRTKLRNLIISRLAEYLPFPQSIIYSLRQKFRAPVREEKGVYWLEDLLRRSAGPVPEVKTKPDDIAVLEYTGGTTGASKAACLTHRNLIANVFQCRWWLPDLRVGREVFLCIIPFFFHTTSLIFPIYVKSTMVLVPRFDVDELLRLIHRYKPTLFMGVPTIYEALVKHPKLGRFDLSFFRFCLSGSAPLSPEVSAKFKNLTGCEIIEGYGLTEASPAALCNPLRGRKRGVGIPLPDTDCKVVDLETGEELPSGIPGELCLKGPQVMAGYWNRPQETEKALKDGWLHTGDVAVMDEEGYFHLLDRREDLIVIRRPDQESRAYVFPSEVEEFLQRHPGVLEAAVIGLPDPHQGQRPKAFVVLREGQECTPEELIEFCRQGLPDYKVPAQVEFRKELPKSGTGKVLRRRLREEESKAS